MTQVALESTSCFGFQQNDMLVQTQALYSQKEQFKLMDPIIIMLYQSQQAQLARN